MNREKRTLRIGEREYGSELQIVLMACKNAEIRPAGYRNLCVVDDQLLSLSSMQEELICQ